MDKKEIDSIKGELFHIAEAGNRAAEIIHDLFGEIERLQSGIKSIKESFYFSAPECHGDTVGKVLRELTGE